MNRSFVNTVKTALLLGCMWALLLGIGALLSSGTGSSSWIVIFAFISLASTAYSYWNSDKLALRAMHARPVSRADFPWYHDTVRELSEAAGQPMPRLYVAPTPSPNAFATGRNPQHAAVCVTDGILDILNQRELRAVLGHELMHVYNRDILTSSIAAGMAGIITSIAQFAFFFGGGRRRDGGGGGFAVILMALAAPFAATLIQLAISRTREFDADHDGAELANDPLALASALKKISGGAAAAPMRKDPATETMSHMMIANPFNLKSLFSTHPPMEERIRRLERLAGYER